MANTTLLVIEANPTQQYVLRQLCEAFDFEVHVFRSGEEALHAVAMTNYAAILIDLSLPEMDGMECVRKIRLAEKRQNKTKSTPIIAMTSRASQEEKQLCLKAGFDAYLGKPFDPEALRKVLLRLISHSQSDRPSLRLLTGSEAPRDPITDLPDLNA